MSSYLSALHAIEHNDLTFLIVVDVETAGAGTFTIGLAKEEA